MADLLTAEEMSEMGLDAEQVNVLKRCFDGFADEDGAIPADNVGNILSMMGLKVKPSALKDIIEEIDEDGEIFGDTIMVRGIMNRCFSSSSGSGLLEFGEFCQLAAKFLVEEDEEALKKELKEAFRIYDKEGELLCFERLLRFSLELKPSQFYLQPVRVAVPSFTFFSPSSSLIRFYGYSSSDSQLLLTGLAIDDDHG